MQVSQIATYAAALVCAALRFDYIVTTTVLLSEKVALLSQRGRGMLRQRRGMGNAYLLFHSPSLTRRWGLGISALENC